MTELSPAEFLADIEEAVRYSSDMFFLHPAQQGKPSYYSCQDCGAEIPLTGNFIANSQALSDHRCADFTDIPVPG